MISCRGGPFGEHDIVENREGRVSCRPLLVVGMNFIPRPLAIGMRFIPMDGGCLPHWDEALDESTGILEAVYIAPYLYGGRSPPYN